VEDLELEFVHGYRCADARNNVFWVNDDVIVYHTKTSGAKGGCPTFGHSEMSKSYPENVRMRGKGRTGITCRRSEKTMKKRSMMSPGPGWM
jgi:hypothetical protein